ncbi:MAG: beta strand repeat-containing protein, partial [Rhodoluna sp.]
TSANITAKNLIASFSTATRAYDGTTAAAVTGSSSDLVAGDSVSYSSTSASFATADAGSGKAVNISGIALGGTDAGNYALQNTSATSTGTISKRDVSLTALTAANKTYDGSVAAVITAGTIATGVTGETLNVSGSAVFADKNAGTGKGVTVADVSALTLANGTGNWNNYRLTTTGSLSTAANIAQAALTVTANAVNKTYDGTLSASGTGTVGALAGAGDAVNSNGSQSYLDKNAGSGNKVVRASGVTIKDASNADMSGNYQITYIDSLTGTIGQAPLQVGVNDVTKTYDGTLAASGPAVVRSGTLYSSDSLSGGSFAFTNKNYGVGNKTVTVSGVTVGDGTHTGNYAVTYVNNTTSTINKAALTVTATGVSKTYDGTLSASGSGVVGVLVAGDAVSSAGSQAYLDANAGTGKVVRASGVTIKDAANADMSGNYQITYQDVNTGVISRATLTAALVGSVSKEYDSTTAAGNLTGANYSVTGWANAGEGVTVSQTAATYASATVASNGGTGSVSTTLQASDFAAVGGTNLSNYVLPTSASGLVGTITRAPLTVKVNDTSMFVTQAPNTAVDNGFTYTGLKNGETAASVVGALTRSYTGAANPAVGSYSGVYDLSAVPTAANYTVTVQKGGLTVVPADKLLINVGSNSVGYGTLTAANAGTGAASVTAQYCLTRATATVPTLLT